MQSAFAPLGRLTRVRCPSIAAALSSFAVPLLLSAQDATRTEPGRCYRGRPAPACSRFVITEIGLYQRAAGSRTTFTAHDPGNPERSEFSFTLRDFAPQLTWELGLMANRGPQSALGATVLLGLSDDGGGANVGLKGRYRRWIGDGGLALDVGAGLTAGTLDIVDGKANGGGITGDIALNAADYGALVLRVDAMRADNRTATALFTGFRLGSKPALGATGLLGVMVLLIGSAVANADS